MAPSLDDVRSAAEALEAARRRLVEVAAGAAADGASLRAIGEAAGMSHEGIRKMLRGAAPAGPSEDQLRARLAELEGRWEMLVDRLAPQFEPPDPQREQLRRNLNNGKARRQASGRTRNGKTSTASGGRKFREIPTVRAETRRLAEREILRSLTNHPEDPLTVKIEAELAEARQIRVRLVELAESRAGF